MLRDNIVESSRRHSMYSGHLDVESRKPVSPQEACSCSSNHVEVETSFSPFESHGNREFSSELHLVSSAYVQREITAFELRRLILPNARNSLGADDRMRCTGVHFHFQRSSVHQELNDDSRYVPLSDAVHREEVSIRIILRSGQLMGVTWRAFLRRALSFALETRFFEVSLLVAKFARGFRVLTFIR
ncbi:unnamed protein product [Ixodes persulcatus]